MTKKLLCEFDPEGWTQLQDMAVAYGKAYFRKWVQVVLHKKAPLMLRDVPSTRRVFSSCSQRLR